MNVDQKPLSGMRVLAAVNGLELFGHERGNIEVFKVLRDMGANLLVGVNGKPDNHVCAELHRLGFETFDLPFGAQWSIIRVRKDPSLVFKNTWAVLKSSWIFSQVIRRFKPRHIHLGSPLAYSYVSLALVAHKTPLVYRMGDCPPVDSPFNLRIWRMAMRRSMRVVANSEYVCNTALMAGVKNISVIYNLAPSTTVLGNDTATECNYVGGLLYVGALAPHKGLHLLVEAFAKVVGDYPQLGLNVVGGSRYDGAYRNQIRQRVDELNLNDRVSFHGHVDNPSIFYKQCTMHLVPSVWEEPSANVVMEAKREGAPSIVFPSGGLPELINHRVDGYVCAEKSVDALEQAIRWMLADTARLKRMRAVAIQDSNRRFGRDRFARQWAGIYLSSI